MLEQSSTDGGALSKDGEEAMVREISIHLTWPALGIAMAAVEGTWALGDSSWAFQVMRTLSWMACVSLSGSNML